MKKIFLSTVLLYASVTMLSAQNLKEAKTIEYKTQDDLITREELNTIKKNALAKAKNQEELGLLIDEAYNQHIARKQAQMIEAQAPKIVEVSAEKATIKTKAFSNADQKGMNEKMASIRADYNKKRTEMLNDLNKQKYANADDKQKALAESEAKLKSQYPTIF
jgi:hypothetical protein